MDKKIAIHTMELWLANLPVTPGHVQHGTRPVVIVSNDVANNFSPIVTAVPLTSNRKAATLPTHVCLRGYGLAAHQHRQVRAGHGAGQVVPHSPPGRGLRLV